MLECPRIAATCPYAGRAARKQHAHSPENLAAPLALAQRRLGVAAWLDTAMDASSLGSGHRSGSGGRVFAGAPSGTPHFPSPVESRARRGVESPGRRGTTEAAVAERPLSNGKIAGRTVGRGPAGPVVASAHAAGPIHGRLHARI